MRGFVNFDKNILIMKNVLTVIAMLVTTCLNAQIDNLSDFLKFASMNENSRKYVLIAQWEPVGIKKDYSESGESMFEEIKYKHKKNNVNFELSLGSYIQLLHTDIEESDIKQEADNYLTLKIGSEVLFLEWIKQFKELGISLDEHNDYSGKTWSAFLFNPIYRFSRIMFKKELNNGRYEYVIYI